MTNLATDGDRLTLRDLALNAYREAERAREEGRREQEEQARARRLTHLRLTAQRVLDFSREHAEEVIPATGDGRHFTVDGLHFRVSNEEYVDRLEVYALRAGAGCPEWQGFSDLDDLGGILTTSAPEDPAGWVVLYDTRQSDVENDAYRTLRRGEAQALLTAPDSPWTVHQAEG